jgi:hypothetical protein
MIGFAEIDRPGAGSAVPSGLAKQQFVADPPLKRWVRFIATAGA